MSETDNMATVHQTWAAWNAHDPDAWVKLLDEKQVIESDTIPHPIGGHEGARAFMQMYVKAFPDLHFAIDQMIARAQKNDRYASDDQRQEVVALFKKGRAYYEKVATEGR